MTNLLLGIALAAGLVFVLELIYDSYVEYNKDGGSVLMYSAWTAMIALGLAVITWLI
jgi:hypothetical protein